jgi:glycosyltransferase involved in cell wall biosynthesis
MLRTLHITNSWHPTSGGIGTFYRALLASANEVPWHARLVVPSSETRYEPVGAHAGIYHVRAPRAPYSPEYRVLYPHTYLLPGSPLRSILRTEQPDVVEVNDKYTLTYLAGLLRVGRIAEMRQRPAVVGLSCERMDETLRAYLPFDGFHRWFARLYQKALYFPQFDHHIAVSRHVASELEAASKGHKVERGVWIRGMGVDTCLFTSARRNAAARSALLQQARCPDAASLLLYAGRLAPEKNLTLLLDTLSSLDDRNYRLLIAGDGPGCQAFLDEANRRVPGLVCHLGHVASRERLADLYANVDAFLHPNPREPFGIAPLEAMAAGVPLVAPASGGVTAYANVGNAWVTEPTGAAFAAALLQIRDDPTETAQRVGAARATAVRLNWSSVCRNYYELYGSLSARTSLAERSSLLEPDFYSTPGDFLGRELWNKPDERTVHDES